MPAPRRTATAPLVVALATALAAGCSTGGDPPTSATAGTGAGSATTAAGGTVAGTGSGTGASAGSPTTTAPSPAATTSARVPRLAVEVVTDRLRHGWDIGFLPDGRVLVTERPGRITLLSNGRAGATVTRVEADLSDVMAVGEGGLLGMVVHPDFATSRLFTTCLDHAEAGRAVDVRLVTWRLSADGRSAARVRTLLAGLPVNPSGRHSGCRPTIGADGALYVGTGDTARARVAQDLASLGGKVLRLDLETGDPLPDNPFADSANRAERYVYTYGHRNVQGVAVRPGTGQIVTVEHGPSVDDEVNVLRAGANYGWDPSSGGATTAYDESVPMTDRTRFPDAVHAVWRSGSPTLATCADAFLSGEQWGAWDGALAVTALKGARLLVMTLDGAGAVRSVATPGVTDGTYGRLRAARVGPDGALYVTTSNGTSDKLLRITPS